MCWTNYTIGEDLESDHPGFNDPVCVYHSLCVAWVSIPAYVFTLYPAELTLFLLMFVITNQLTKQVYRSRRAELAKLAREYSSGSPIPYVTYTKEEVDTWGAVYDRLGVRERMRVRETIVFCGLK